MTWVLIIFFGTLEPVMVEGYASLDACESAGSYAVSRMKRCGLTHVRCAFDCIEGPEK